VLESLGVEQLIRDLGRILETFISGRQLKLLIYCGVAANGIQFLAHVSRLLDDKCDSVPSLSPLWQNIALSVLTINLHLRMVMAGGTI
jgi:hypothetical protein